MEDQTVIASLKAAAESGLTKTTLLAKAGSKKGAEASIRSLKKQGRLACVGRRFYLPGNEPNAGKVADLLLAFLSDRPKSALNSTALSRAVRSEWKPFVKEALARLKDSRQIGELQTGKTRLYFHRDAVAHLFASQPDAAKANHAANRSTVLEAYRDLIARRGGFRTLPISELQSHTTLALPELHAVILDEIEAHRANIYRSTSALTPQSVRDAAIYLPNDPEPYVSVEFYN